jgi:hypothetical protein
VNHALRHLNLWLLGDASEDHLAHGAWNLLALMHFEERRRELIDVPNRPQASFAPRIYKGDEFHE